MNNYQNRLSELDILLDYIDDSEWVKIPDNIIFFIKDNKNKDYDWKYDESVPFENQNISPDTYSLLTLIYYKYIASQEEKKLTKQLIIDNSIELRNKYNIHSIFPDEQIKDKNVIEKEPINKNLPLIQENKKINIFKKIINFFKNLF